MALTWSYSLFVNFLQTPTVLKGYFHSKYLSRAWNSWTWLSYKLLIWYTTSNIWQLRGRKISPNHHWIWSHTISRHVRGNKAIHRTMMLGMYQEWSDGIGSRLWQNSVELKIGFHDQTTVCKKNPFQNSGKLVVRSSFYKAGIKIILRQSDKEFITCQK